jgi:hypothetical protein
MGAGLHALVLWAANLESLWADGLTSHHQKSLPLLFIIISFWFLFSEDREEAVFIFRIFLEIPKT